MSERPIGESERFHLATTGDRVAIGELLVYHVPAIEGFIRRNAGRLLAARETPSDLAQSVCLEVLERLRDGRVRYEGEAPFRAWLYRAAVMKMMTRRRFWQAERRDPGRVRRQDVDESRDEAPAFVDRATPSQDAVLHEEMERLASALAALPAKYREVIALHHIERLSHREIGVRMQVSETYSRVLLARALARLATLTEQY